MIVGSNAQNAALIAEEIEIIIGSFQVNIDPIIFIGRHSELNKCSHLLIDIDARHTVQVDTFDIGNETLRFRIPFHRDFTEKHIELVVFIGQIKGSVFHIGNDFLIIIFI